MQAGIAGVGDRRAQNGTGEVGGNGPRTGEPGFKATIAQDIGPDIGDTAADETEIIQINVTGGLQIKI